MRRKGNVWVDESYVLEPRASVVRVLRNYWWATNEKGQVGLYYYGPGNLLVMPQCNHNKKIAEAVGKKVPGFYRVKKIELAFAPYLPWEERQ